MAALRRSATPITDEAIQALLPRVRKALGTRDLPEIMLSKGVDRPVVIGVVRPVVILPGKAIRGLCEERLIDVLVHECAHVVRRDPWVGLLQRAAQMLYWPHPLVYVLNRHLARVREEVCDNYVLRQGDATRYARTLLELSEGVSRDGRMAPACGLFRLRWSLEDRIRGLLDQRRMTMTRVSRWITGALTGMFLLAAAAIAGVGPEDRMETLLREHSETLQKAFAAYRTAYEEGNVPLRTLVEVESQWRDAELEGVTGFDRRVAVLRKHVQLLTELEKNVEARYRIGSKGGSTYEYWGIKAARQAAEIVLLRELKTGPR